MNIFRAPPGRNPPPSARCHHAMLFLHVGEEIGFGDFGNCVPLASSPKLFHHVIPVAPCLCRNQRGEVHSCAKATRERFYLLRGEVESNETFLNKGFRKILYLLFYKKIDNRKNFISKRPVPHLTLPCRGGVERIPRTVVQAQRTVGGDDWGALMGCDCKTTVLDPASEGTPSQPHQRQCMGAAGGLQVL